MAKLTGQTIADSYDQLLIVGDANGISSSLQAVESADDGGSSSALSISTVAISVTGNATITTADNTDTLALISTDTDANAGPNLNLYRNSGSPLDNDFLGNIKFNGRNDNSQDVQYAEIEVYATDVSDSSESGLFNLNLMTGGTNRTYMQLQSDEVVFNEDQANIDFRVESNGNTHMLFVDAGNNRVGICDSSPSQTLSIDVNSSTTTSAGANGIEIGNSNTTGDNMAKLGFSFGAGMGSMACIAGKFDTRTGGSETVDLIFGTIGAGSYGERMHIKGDGKIGIGTASPGDYSASADNLVIYDANHAGITIASPTNKSGNLFFADGTSGDSEYEGFIQYDHGNNVIDAMMFGTAGEEKMRISSLGEVFINRQASPSGMLNINTADGRYGMMVDDTYGNDALCLFRDDGTGIGSITIVGGQTAFNATSDYRLKENEVTLANGLTRLNQLKPYNFNFIAHPDIVQDGFFAHEVAGVVPVAVTGEKDAVDDDGDIEPQQLDNSKLVPLLVKAIQELSAKVEALENA
jgi:hypothetical protein